VKPCNGLLSLQAGYTPNRWGSSNSAGLAGLKPATLCRWASSDPHVRRDRAEAPAELTIESRQIAETGVVRDGADRLIGVTRVCQRPWNATPEENAQFGLALPDA
jgi:hypothetical protein